MARRWQLERLVRERYPQLIARATLVALSGNLDEPLVNQLVVVAADGTRCRAAELPAQWRLHLVRRDPGSATAVAQVVVGREEGEVANVRARLDTASGALSDERSGLPDAACATQRAAWGSPAGLRVGFVAQEGTKPTHDRGVSAPGSRDGTGAGGPASHGSGARRPPGGPTGTASRQRGASGSAA